MWLPRFRISQEDVKCSIADVCSFQVEESVCNILPCSVICCLPKMTIEFIAVYTYSDRECRAYNVP